MSANGRYLKVVRCAACVETFRQVPTYTGACAACPSPVDVTDQVAALHRQVETEKAIADVFSERAVRAEAEVERMRPVVDAARAVRGGKLAPSSHFRRGDRAMADLMDAVDALGEETTDEPMRKRWQRECPDCQAAIETGHRLCDDHEDGETDVE